MNTLKELDRYRTGLAYGRTSINNHSIRAFTFKGKTYYLDRTTDCQPRYFQLYTFPPGGGIAQIVKVNGQNFWGDNLSWTKAVQIVQDCLQKHPSNRRITPCKLHPCPRTRKVYA